MSDLPKTMKALKIVAPGKVEVQEVPLPRLRDDYILVKVHAVALNPTDWYVRSSYSLPEMHTLTHRLGSTLTSLLSLNKVSVAPSVATTWAPSSRSAPR